MALNGAAGMAWVWCNDEMGFFMMRRIRFEATRILALPAERGCQEGNACPFWRVRVKVLGVLLWLAATGALPAQAEVTAVAWARGLAHPWALAFLPDGRALVTERQGRLRLIDAQGQVSAPLEGLPKVDFAGQCGLLDVAVDPQFASNALVYWTFAEPSPDGTGNSTAVARGRLVGQRLEDVRVIFSQVPKVASRLHCGSRIAFDRDGHLYVGLGDRYSEKDEAQNLGNHIGKIVRITREGQAPADNPFVRRPGARPEIWSLGHRNIQGLTVHPQTGQLWATEHGPQGGDEVNRIEPGRNYGWPRVTYGRNYGTGTRIGEEGPVAGFEQPLKWWTPLSIAPSGLGFVKGDRYPGWTGQLLLGALRGQALVRLAVSGQTATGERRELANLTQRVRDVREAPDGWIYVVTDGPDGQVLRLRP